MITTDVMVAEFQKENAPMPSGEMGGMGGMM
jgi:hypothetical protein